MLGFRLLEFLARFSNLSFWPKYLATGQPILGGADETKRQRGYLLFEPSPNGCVKCSDRSRFPLTHRIDRNFLLPLTFSLLSSSDHERLVCETPNHLFIESPGTIIKILKPIYGKIWSIFFCRTSFVLKIFLNYWFSAIFFFLIQLAIWLFFYSTNMPSNLRSSTSEDDTENVK